jgi:phage shock protein PspC (stress-responsive transcriptional regulator)
LEVPAVHERLYRSRDDRMLFGVAGGMADWLDIDPAIVRIVWALLIFAAGTGILLYIVAAIVIPEEPLDRADVAVPMGGGPASGVAPAAAPGPVADPGELAVTAASGVTTAGGGDAAAAGAAAPAAAAPAAAAPGAGPPPTPATTPTSAWGYPSRREAREARRAERRAARGQREGNGVLILGVILIAIGGWLLARMYIPFFDDRIVGPAFLVVVGILLLASAMNRPRQSPPS